MASIQLSRMMLRTRAKELGFDQYGENLGKLLPCSRESRVGSGGSAVVHLRLGNDRLGWDQDQGRFLARAKHLGFAQYGDNLGKLLPCSRESRVGSGGSTVVHLRLGYDR